MTRLSIINISHDYDIILILLSYFSIFSRSLTLAYLDKSKIKNKALPFFLTRSIH